MDKLNFCEYGFYYKDLTNIADVAIRSADIDQDTRLE